MNLEWSVVFGCSAVLGIIFGMAWIGAYFLSWVWAWSWAWVDDCEAPKDNPLILRVMTKMGYGEGDWLYRYKKDKHKTDGERAFFFPLLALVLTPTLAALLTFIYPVTLCAICLYLIARLTRFARRHKKLFDKHIKDPSAHR